MVVISTGSSPIGVRMTRRAIGFLLTLLVVAFAGEARAWTPFGTVEHISRMEDVGLTTPAGDALFLGYKTSTVYFLLGVYVANDGYVLGLRSNPKHYVDMPPPDVLADFQKKGLLPAPLPPYSLGFGDYLKGYSLWIVVVPLLAAYVAAFVAIRSRRRRRHRPTRY